MVYVSLMHFERSNLLSELEEVTYLGTKQQYKIVSHAVCALVVLCTIYNIQFM